jgi:hypothetical protein
VAILRLLASLPDGAPRPHNLPPSHSKVKAFRKALDRAQKLRAWLRNNPEARNQLVNAWWSGRISARAGWAWCQGPGNLRGLEACEDAARHASFHAPSEFFPHDKPYPAIRNRRTQLASMIEILWLAPLRMAWL